MNWIMLIIIASSYGDHKSVTVTTIPFQSKYFCEAAEELVHRPYGFDTKTECIRVHKYDEDTEK